MVVRWSTGLVQVHLVAGPVSPQAHPVIFPPSAGMCNWNRHTQQWARCLTRTLVTMPSWLRRAWPQGPELGPLLPASAHLLGGVYFPINMLRAPTFPAPDSYSCLFNIALGCLTGERIQNQTPATPARALPRPAPGSASCSTPRLILFSPSLSLTSSPSANLRHVSRRGRSHLLRG